MNFSDWWENYAAENNVGHVLYSRRKMISDAYEAGRQACIKEEWGADAYKCKGCGRITHGNNQNEVCVNCHTLKKESEL